MSMMNNGTRLRLEFIVKNALYKPVFESWVVRYVGPLGRSCAGRNTEIALAAPKRTLGQLPRQLGVYLDCASQSWYISPNHQ
eukprot:scaffold164234_cov42-Cyclotella_meneghiniana.AAC.1